MKLLNRKEFLDTEIGTIFSYYTKGWIVELDWLCIKWSWKGDYSNDFICQSIYNEIWFEFFNDWMDNQLEAEKRLENGESINIDENCYWRDWMFEEKQKFIVFEKKDIEKMIKNLLKWLLTNQN